MKKTFLLLISLFIAIGISAQENITMKKAVGVTTFSYSSVFSQAEAVTIRNAVIAGLTGTGRVEVVDPSTSSDVQSARDRNKSEGAMNAAELTGEMQPSSYDKPVSQILTGNLDNISVTQESYTNKKTGETSSWYSAKLQYTLKLVDATSGSVIGTQSYTATGRDDNDPNAARTKAVNSCGGSIDDFVQAYFPVEGNVIALDQANGSKAKTVYIDLGSDFGISKSQKFDVFKTVNIAGAESKKLIGTITVSEVMAGNRALCKVNKGAEDILAELQKGAKLPIKSRATRDIFDTLGKIGL